MVITKHSVAKRREDDRSNYDPLYLVRRLSHGLAGWLTFVDVGRRQQALNEYYLYAPIFEMSLGRRWTVRPQRAIVGEIGKKGAPKTIDFVMYKKRTRKASDIQTAEDSCLALEIKLTTNSVRFPKTYAYDCKKLSVIEPEHILLSKFPNLKCAFMIAGKRDHIKYLADFSCDDEFRDKLRQQLKTILDQQPGTETDSGWFYDSGPPHSSTASYRVVVMVCQSWWKTGAKL